MMAAVNGRSATPVFRAEFPRRPAEHGEEEDHSEDEDAPPRGSSVGAGVGCGRAAAAPASRACGCGLTPRTPARQHRGGGEPRLRPWDNPSGRRPSGLAAALTRPVDQCGDPAVAGDRAAGRTGRGGARLAHPPCGHARRRRWARYEQHHRQRRMWSAGPPDQGRSRRRDAQSRRTRPRPVRGVPGRWCVISDSAAGATSAPADALQPRGREPNAWLSANRRRGRRRKQHSPAMNSCACEQVPPGRRAAAARRRPARRR